MLFRSGIVHHSNYARFFEEARLEYLNQAGLPYASLEEMGIVVPVLACSSRNKRPLRFPQEFSVTCKLEAFNGIRFRVSYTIYVKGEKGVAATGETEHCFVDRAMRPLRVDKHYPDLVAGMYALLQQENTKSERN